MGGWSSSDYGLGAWSADDDLSIAHFGFFSIQLVIVGLSICFCNFSSFESIDLDKLFVARIYSGKYELLFVT